MSKDFSDNELPSVHAHAKLIFHERSEYLYLEAAVLLRGHVKTVVRRTMAQNLPEIIA